MSSRTSCFGKLPFQLMESLQSEMGGKLWADAVEVTSDGTCLASIDTVRIDPNDIPGSIVLGILHAMNDIFSANAEPQWLSISMTLPLETDADILVQVNRSVLALSSAIDCKIGKIHTMRTSSEPSLTTCVAGKPTGVSNLTSENGFVTLMEGSSVLLESNNLRLETAIAALVARSRLIHLLAGPKKDLSGDGLAGALYQLCVREGTSISLWSSKLEALPVPKATEGLERNYVDYGAIINGGRFDTDRRLLFSPHIFGPLLCLVSTPIEDHASDRTIIGSFVRGAPAVWIVDK